MELPSHATRASINRALAHMKTICTRCGGEWSAVATGRSMWLRPLQGGPGEVWQVCEVYCPKCDPVPELPAYGTPIYYDEVVELGGMTRVHADGEVRRP